MKTALPLVALVLALAPAAARSSGLPSASPAATPSGSAAALPGSDWIVKSEDNVCGLRDANQLTYPGLVDYDACLEATPEMKRIDEHGIDPKSAEGIQLRNAAVTRVTKACEEVRKATGHCSVWKAVRHKDGRSITDLTDQVKAKL